MQLLFACLIVHCPCALLSMYISLVVSFLGLQVLLLLYFLLYYLWLFQVGLMVVLHCLPLVHLLVLLVFLLHPLLPHCYHLSCAPCRLGCLHVIFLAVSGHQSHLDQCLPRHLCPYLHLIALYLLACSHHHHNLQCLHCGPLVQPNQQGVVILCSCLWSWVIWCPGCM